MPTLRIGRRDYLRSVGGSIATTGMAGTTVTASTTATDEVPLTGKVTAPDGSPVAHRKVVVNEARDGIFRYVETDSEGVFSTEVGAKQQYELALYKSGRRQLLAPVQNGVPHIDRLGSYSVGSSKTDIGTISVKQAYLINLHAIDSNGNPVPDAGFGIRADGYGAGNALSADDSGYMVINNADFKGAELAKSAKVTIKIPTGGDAVTKYKESIYVNQPMTITAREGEGISVQKHGPNESTKTTTTTQTTTETTTTTSTTTTTTTETTLPTTETTSSTTSTATRSSTSQTTPHSTTRAVSANETTSRPKRGFLSNGESADNYEFLTNPFFLTVGGFVLSVAGIAQNLLRGR